MALVTLPLTGLSLWSEWLSSLGVYQASQPGLPTLYGFGLPRYVPFALYGLLAAAAVVLALRVRGPDSLARLGAATVVASPSLFGHGLLVAVPSMLSLRSPWLWLAIGLLSTPSWPRRGSSRRCGAQWGRPNRCIHCGRISRRGPDWRAGDLGGAYGTVRWKTPVSP